jgi:FkbM family methyltransferase
MNHFEHIQNTFTLDHRPANVRAGRLFARLPFLHRYQRWPIGLGLIPAEGRFTYRRAGRTQVVTFNGRNLQFHALYERSYRYGYELETALLISALCRDQRPFLDIGANWGYFSLLAASLPDFSGPIYAFEPNPRTFADLTATIKQAAVADRVTACQIGVGSKACEMTVTEVSRFETGVSRLTAGGAGAKIPVKPVDALELGPPGFMKIDAEGMELDILQGAVGTLAQARPFVVLENFLDYAAPEKTYGMMDFLSQNDYRIFLPVLEFAQNNTSVLLTYDQDYAASIERAGPPRLGVVEVFTPRRFLLGLHVNLLGVPAANVDELWKAGILDFGKM